MWDVDANLEQDNLSFADLSGEAQRQGGFLRGEQAAPDARSFDRAARPTRARRGAERPRTRTVDALQKEIDVAAPVAVVAAVKARAEARKMSVEDLVHQHVLANAESPAPISSSITPADAAVGPEMTFTLHVGSVLAVLVRGGAQTGGFARVEDYCAAVFKEIAAGG